MQKVYKYGNAMVYIEMYEHAYDNIHKATEIFLRKVVKENDNGNSYKTGSINKK